MDIFFLHITFKNNKFKHEWNTHTPQRNLWTMQSSNKDLISNSDVIIKFTRDAAASPSKIMGICDSNVITIVSLFHYVIFLICGPFFIFFTNME